MEHETNNQPSSPIESSDASVGKIQFPPGKHLVWLPVVLSLLLAGTGQAYNRQYFKAIFIVAATFFAFYAFGRLGSLFMIIYAASDAKAIASRLRRGQAVGKLQFF
jgi:hypothetical protein